MSESASGLMDATLSPEDNARIQAILDAHAEPGRIEFHAVRTRESGARQFMEMHMLVPGDWTVLRGMTPWKTWWRRSWRSFPPCA